MILGARKLLFSSDVSSRSSHSFKAGRLHLIWVIKNGENNVKVQTINTLEIKRVHIQHRTLI
ncbi:hypothetical protein ACU8KH_05586 [Lachancea thermotolerans]